ncbi:zinc-binding dehydrogenase [Microbacterium indicum]|uniref:zinc-binding dehydrogenase n=1 Tax=Microbacterium indicum TaxID=358100 RepID=UPI0003F55D96|nr:zinc-binding dehydrogenase [Microbacterium indicum]
MRALVHETFGEATDVLRVQEIPTPEPGPGQVRVRTILSPIHNHDLWTIRGTYGFKPELPAQSGTEAVGVVDALGEGVENLSVGQRVTGSTFGVWAEHFVAPAAGMIPVPDGVDDETAAQLVSMPFSALALLDSLAVEPGQWIVQNTANGAVGRLVAQFARARGVNVLGLVRRDAAVAELAEASIDRVVSTEHEGWRDEAFAILGDDRPVTAVDSVGGAGTADLISVLGDDGSVVVFGSMGSADLAVTAADVIFRGISVRGFWGSRVSRELAPEKRAELFGELFRRVGGGEVRLPVERIFSFDEAREAAAASDTAGRVGKILLRP